MHSTVARQDSLPVRAIGSTAGHRPQQMFVDRNDLAYGAGGDVHSAGGTRVDGNTNAALVLECQRGRTSVVFDANLAATFVHKHSFGRHQTDARGGQLSDGQQLPRIIELIGNRLVGRLRVEKAELGIRGDGKNVLQSHF